MVAGEVEIDTSELTADRRPQCGRVKHLPMTRGFFPALVGRTTSLARTVQYFGSGASAFRPVIAHREIAQALAERKVQGVSPRPVAH